MKSHPLPPHPSLTHSHRQSWHTYTNSRPPLFPSPTHTPRVTSELDMIQEQQSELEEMLTQLEGRVPPTPIHSGQHADMQRTKTCDRGEACVCWIPYPYRHCVLCTDWGACNAIHCSVYVDNAISSCTTSNCCDCTLNHRVFVVYLTGSQWLKTLTPN